MRSRPSVGGDLLASDDKPLTMTHEPRAFARIEMKPDTASNNVVPELPLLDVYTQLLVPQFCEA